MRAPRPTEGFDVVFVIVCADGLVRDPVAVELFDVCADRRAKLSDMRCGCFAGGHTYRRIPLRGDETP